MCWFLVHGEIPYITQSRFVAESVASRGYRVIEAPCHAEIAEAMAITPTQVLELMEDLMILADRHPACSARYPIPDNLQRSPAM